MSMENSFKRSIEELDTENAKEESNESQPKQIKTETEPNLEISSPNKNETETLGDERKLVPCITIKFQEDVISDLYKSKFIQFLNSFAEFQVDESNNNIDIYRNETEFNLPTSAKKRKKHSKVKKELFVVDATPSPTFAQAELRYTTKFTINTEKVVEEKTSQSSKSACFNCDELHALKDCPYPKDYSKINMARQKFKSQPKSSRYHLEEDQKYSHLEPGKITSELRKALGLHRNEVPHYIYLMRKLGYPPGWLEEAKFVHSNLNMFDIDGNHVQSIGAKKKGLDESKIVEYPGFNVPLQKGMKDDYRIYRVPPYSENFGKNAMITFFDKQCAQEEDNLETCDMDIDHDPVGSESEKPSEVKSTGRKSPSLTDLEQQKKQLLEELNEDPKVGLKDIEKEVLNIKTSCFGTPILKSSSPFSTLPNADNFSKDVSPVINFENLPNSTGKYEQLTDVLHKVRSTLKRIQNCNT